MEKQNEMDSHSNINCGIWMKSVTSKVRQSLKLQWPSVATRGTDTAIGQVFPRINVCLVLVCVYLEVHRQLLTADPYTNFHRANEMRTAAQRALFKQNSAHAVQAAGLARHRSQPRENINAGDTTMVWRNNNLTGKGGLDQVSWLQYHQRKHLSGSPCEDAF